MPRQEIKARQLALDRQHGASFLLRQALLLLKDEAAELPCGNWLEYLQELESLAVRLQRIRPVMASIFNGLQVFREGIDALRIAAPPEHPVEAVSILVEQILKALDRDYDLTVKNGAAMISNGDRLLSCSFSATVASALLQAAAEGKNCSVLMVEAAQGSSPMSYGEMMASTLRVGGIQCQVISMSQLPSHLGKLNLALIGADSILADGTVINGHPSLELAQACLKSHIPFYCLCESHKFAAHPPALPLEEGFDLIPVRLISKVITERSGPSL